jgi:hypothetical protein
MKKSIQIGLLLTNDGVVESKYRTRRNLAEFRAISNRQKMKARTALSSTQKKWRDEKIQIGQVEEFAKDCLRLSIETHRYSQMRMSRNPHCLIIAPRKGGDPHLVVCEESEWLKHMNIEGEEIVGTKSIEISGEQKTPQVIQAPTLIPEEPLVQFKISDPFSAAQMEYIRKSRQQRESLHRILCGSITGEGTYRHLILSGPPGLGKTHFVRSFFELRNTPIVRITGAVSLFSLGIKLAVIMANCDPNEVLYIHIDDADVAFRTEEGCNLLKQMLFDERAFVYEKNIGPLLLSFPSEVREAVEGFRTDGSLGFRVPLINVVFIVTTNIPLPADKDVRRHMGGNGHSGILVHRNAIRSRCRYRTLDFNNEQRWAWIADAFMEDGELRRDQNFVIKSMLDFLWEYRAVTQELTMRAAEKMLIMAKEHPTHYYQEWKDEFLWQLN